MVKAAQFAFSLKIADKLKRLTWQFCRLEQFGGGRTSEQGQLELTADQLKFVCGFLGYRLYGECVVLIKSFSFDQVTADKVDDTGVLVYRKRSGNNRVILFDSDVFECGLGPVYSVESESMVTDPCFNLVQGWLVLW